MERIFHEKQQGSLCAQHCLNALLQGSYFTAVDLATIGHLMDDEERQRMAEAGDTSEEYQRFLEQPSSNVDDSGYFSVQVLSKALSVWGLELLPYSSSDPIAVKARECPHEQQAFICHYRDHWLTIRKIGNQWFNLNSILAGPELLSDTYLSLYLAQLQNDHYSIFIVVGDLPSCEADNYLRLNPVPLNYKRNQPKGLQTEEIEDDEQLKAALEMSRQQLEDEEEQESFNQAILLSLQSSQSTTKVEVPVDDDELKRAIALSLEASVTDEVQPAPSEAESANLPENVEFIRQKRLIKLGQESSKE